MRLRPHHPRPARRGFTLLELILATAVAASIGVALATSMSIAFRARTSAHAQVELMRRATIALDIAQRDLESVLTPAGTTTVDGEGFPEGLAGPFVGYAMGTTGAAADSVEFYALGRDVGDDGPFGEGVRRVQLALVSDGETRLFVRRVWRNLLAPIEPEPTEEVIARGVRSFAVRYYDGYAWVTEWDSTLQGDVLPLAVQMTLELEPTDPSRSDRRYALARVIPLATATLPATDEELTGARVE